MLLDALPPEDEPEETRVIESEWIPGERWGPDARAGRRTQVSAGFRGQLITIECEPDTTVPYVDGPASVGVDGDAEQGFFIDGQLGNDAAIMLPAEIDLRLDVNGTDFTLTGIDGTIAAELNVANLSIEGRFADGQSRIEANAAGVELRLRPGSDVEVISRSAAMMHVEGLEHTGRGRWSLGAGTAKFEIGGHLGSITVSAL